MKIKFDDLDLQSLVRLLLPYNWQRECEIVVDDDKGTVLVKYHECFLRYSKGPKQGYFWDTYGDDFQNTNVALIALSKAPPPYRWREPVLDIMEGYGS